MTNKIEQALRAAIEAMNTCEFILDYSELEENFYTYDEDKVKEALEQCKSALEALEKCEPLPPIEYDADMDRYYIPMIGGWEIQTKGKGSTFRICNTKTHVRWPVLDEHLHEALEQMAKDNRQQLNTKG